MSSSHFPKEPPKLPDEKSISIKIRNNKVSSFLPKPYPMTSPLLKIFVASSIIHTIQSRINVWKIKQGEMLILFYSVEDTPKEPMPHLLQKRSTNNRKKNNNSSPSSNSPHLKNIRTKSKKKNNKDSSQSCRPPKPYPIVSLLYILYTIFTTLHTMR